MGTIFASLAVSLDGYIASNSKDPSWMSNALVQGEDYGFDDTTKRTGIYIIGSNTYKEMLQLGMATGNSAEPTYVVTRSTDLKIGANTHLYQGELKTLAEKVRSETDKDICLWGGGNLISRFIDLDLLDELRMAILPVLLGEGVPLFQKITSLKKARLAEYKGFDKSGIVLLTYTFESSFSYVD